MENRENIIRKFAWMKENFDFPISDYGVIMPIRTEKKQNSDSIKLESKHIEEW